MENNLTTNRKEGMHQGTFVSYFAGFLLSLIFTAGAYMLVQSHLSSEHGWPGHPLITELLVGLALAQFLVQLFFFLHLGQETKPRWKLVVLFSTISVVLILVLGSIVIMRNLNYNMTPDQVRAYMQKEN